jgi:hypothetical protein
VEKSGLDEGCELGDTCDGGRGSISSSTKPHVLYSALLLSEFITVSHIWFWDNRQTHFTREAAHRCILQTTKTQPPPYTANSQPYSDYNLQASRWKTFLYPLQSLLASNINPNSFVTQTSPYQNAITEFHKVFLRTYDAYALKTNKGLSLG